MPPRSLKSITASVAFPAFILGLDQSRDTANKGGPQNDWSVCTTWALARGMRWYLVDVWRGRVPPAPSEIHCASSTTTQYSRGEFRMARQRQLNPFLRHHADNLFWEGRVGVGRDCDDTQPISKNAAAWKAATSSIGKRALRCWKPA